MKKGKIILIEGTDASGKKTQTTQLFHRLASMCNCALRSFPQYHTPTGKIIRQCYLGDGENEGWFGDPDKVDPKIASLYYAADRLSVKERMKEDINHGINLILDRYVYSNMAHQGGKIEDPKERKDLFTFIEKLEFELLGIPKEDKTIFLYMPTEVAIELRKKREEKTHEKPDGHENNIDHLRRAEKTYIQLAEMYRWDKIDCAPDKTIDSLKTPEEINDEIFKIVLPYMTQ